MGKIIVVAVSLLTIIGIIFSGCTAPAPSPTPSPAPAPAPAPSPAPAPAETIELRYSYQTPPAASTTRDAHSPWSRMIEEATNGRIKVTEYPAQSLAKAAETVEAVRGGVADIGWQTFGTFPGVFPLHSVNTLPFLNLPGGTVNGQKYSAGKINSHIYQELHESIPEMQKEFDGLKLLFVYASEPYHLISKEPVKNMGDLNGMKIRELGGYGSEMWKLLGAAPSFIPGPGIYEAAEKGVVDGAGMAWALNSSFKLYEVFDYWTDTTTNLAGFFLIMNLDKWNSLPKDVQDQMWTVCAMNGAEFWGEAQFGPKPKGFVLDKVKEEGAKFERVALDPGEYDKWIGVAGEPLWDQWLNEMESKGLPGQKVLDKYQELIEKYK